MSTGSSLSDRREDKVPCVFQLRDSLGQESFAIIAKDTSGLRYSVVCLLQPERPCHQQIHNLPRNHGWCLSEDLIWQFGSREPMRTDDFHIWLWNSLSNTISLGVRLLLFHGGRWELPHAAGAIQCSTRVTCTHQATGSLGGYSWLARLVEVKRKSAHDSSPTQVVFGGAAERYAGRRSTAELSESPAAGNRTEAAGDLA